MQKKNASTSITNICCKEETPFVSCDNKYPYFNKKFNLWTDSEGNRLLSLKPVKNILWNKNVLLQPTFVSQQIASYHCYSRYRVSTVRLFSTSSGLRKDESKAEQTVKTLKEKVKEETVATAITENKSVAVPKKSIGQKILGVLKHYAHGFRLLFIDMKIAARLVWRVLHGETLSRREKQQANIAILTFFRIFSFQKFCFNSSYYLCF